MIVGFVLVVAVVVAIAVLGGGKKEVVKTADPYAPNLVVEQATVSQAANFVGATITYIDLTVKNNGPRTVVGGVVQATFRDSLGQAVQTETLPLGHWFVIPWAAKTRRATWRWPRLAPDRRASCG